MQEAGHSVTKFINVYRVGQTFKDGKAFVKEAFLDHPNEQFVIYIQAQQDNDRENSPGNTMEQLLNKA
jgi:hypothetical protein